MADRVKDGVGIESRVREKKETRTSIRNLVAELHVHSTHSDGRNSVRKILESALSKGIDVISITDHDTVGGSLEAIEVVNDEHLPIVVLPGIEISTTDGHLLAYGIEEEVEGGMSMRESCRAVRGLGGLCFLAHPFDFLRHGSLRLQNFLIVDGVEVFNAKNCFNFLAKRFARRYGKPEIAGSDAHSVSTIGYAVNYIMVENNWIDFKLRSEQSDGSGEKNFESLLRSILNARIGGKMIPLIKRIFEK